MGLEREQVAATLRGPPGHLRGRSFAAGTEAGNKPRSTSISLPRFWMSSRASNCPQSRDRAGVLEQKRRLKMARSAQAYVRGATDKFYEWLQSDSRASLPEGPPVWICGDCHLGNLGPVADGCGEVCIEIRDLDQTVIGNPAHDLVRLALSLATAARGSDLPGVTTAQILERMVEGYRRALSSPAWAPELDGPMPKPVARVMRRALRRRWRQLAEERIKNARPTIPIGKKFWPLSKRERRELDELFEDDAVRALITALNGRDSAAGVEVLDAAYWVKGCSSLGRLRYAVVAGVGGKRLCLIDIKEAVSATAPTSSNAPMPHEQAQRVVAGAKALAPYLGERMLPARLHDRSVVVRELLPQDLKLELERLTSGQAVRVSEFLAEVVGRAHARQMDGEQRAGWLKELNGHKTKTLDAPSWLWSSVVDLLAFHEKAYLDHCRRYATEGQNP